MGGKLSERKPVSYRRRGGRSEDEETSVGGVSWLWRSRVCGFGEIGCPARHGDNRGTTSFRNSSVFHSFIIIHLRYEQLYAETTVIEKIPQP